MSLVDENPNIIFNNIKELLSIGTKDRNHSFHTPVFSSISDNNLSNSRVVVLRKFNKNNFTLNFHTDYRSPKIIDLRKNNLTNFVFYDSKIKIQLRIKTITKIHYNNKITFDVWQQTRLSSRKCYLTKKSPSSLTNKAEDGILSHLKGVDPSELESEMGYKNFSVIENTIKDIDWLYLAASGHRRLKITLKKNKPIFQWLIP